jgi:hypothetical protein
MSDGSPQAVAAREAKLLASPLWHERHARQARESARMCDENGHPEAAESFLRIAANLEAKAAELRGGQT